MGGLYAGDDVSARLGVSNIGMCVHIAELYVGDDVSRCGLPANIGRCVHVCELYASVEVWAGWATGVERF